MHSVVPYHGNGLLRQRTDRKDARVGLRQIEGMGRKRFVLSADDDNDQEHDVRRYQVEGHLVLMRHPEGRPSYSAHCSSKQNLRG